MATAPSLFGATPESIQQARDDALNKEANAYAQLDPFQRATAGIYRGANQLAGGVGRMLGGQDPEMAKAAQRQSLLQSLNLNDPSSFARVAQAAFNQGDTAFASELLKSGDEAAARIRTTTATSEAAAARQVGASAYNPGGAPALYGNPTAFPLKDDEGNTMPGAGTTAPSYNIDNVSARLLSMGPAGRAELSALSKTQEDLAKASKAAADATSATAKASFAPQAERAALVTAQANADKAVVDAQFAEVLNQGKVNSDNWNVKNLSSQIGDRTARLGIDGAVARAAIAEKMSNISSKLTDLPEGARKDINAAVVLSSTAKQASESFMSLANNLEQGGGGYGAFSSASDALKKGLGFQGGMTQLRQEYTRIRNTAAIKSLPPGPATDKDISLALSGFPSSNASAADLASFLRGMAKMQAIDGAVEGARADWLVQRKGVLSRSPTAMVVGDYSSRAGESFNDLSTRISRDVSERITGTTAEAQRQARVSQIPTNNNSQQPATRNVMSEADAILRGGR
jgi:hypothetical protein